MVVLGLSVIAFVAYLFLDRSVGEASSLSELDFFVAACQVLPFGVVGAVLVARRADLPFGWLLSLGAVALTIQLPLVYISYRVLEDGGGNELAVWGMSFAVLGFLPIALEGPINVRFPSGKPTGRLGRFMDRALILGIVSALLGGLLGDDTIRSAELPQVPGEVGRFIDGTPVTGIGNALALGTPLVILLGVLAGLGVIVRCFRSEGIERKQLQWRASGVAFALLLFPLAVTETLPAWLVAIEPLAFVATLLIPVLRYDLWAIDSLIRRSAAYNLAASGSAVENLARATGEMLRLSSVVVLRDEVVLASYGQPNEVPPEVWTLTDQGGEVGTLRATPRHGMDSLDERDRQVLATVARLVTESVRADALTADLSQARLDLVTAREEERRRLRRDLHDGLGPLLTGLGLNLDAARTSIGNADARTSAYLGQAKEASTQLIRDLRDLVHDLRPPALDELGLAGALGIAVDQAARDADVTVDLEVGQALDLPAAVEVAAFRTAVEAVNNAVRHSGASRIGVRLEECGDSLLLQVCDDGTRGGAAPWHPGVGLASMRERAEELGGSFMAGPDPDGGRVQVRYPLGGGSGR